MVEQAKMFEFDFSDMTIDMIEDKLKAPRLPKIIESSYICKHPHDYTPDYGRYKYLTISIKRSVLCARMYHKIICTSTLRALNRSSIDDLWDDY